MAFIFDLVEGFLHISGFLLLYILVFSLFYLSLKNTLKNKYNNIKSLPILYLIIAIPFGISSGIQWFISPEIGRLLFILTVSVSLFSAILCYFLLWIEKFPNVGWWIKIILLVIFLSVIIELVAVSSSSESLPPPEIYLSLYSISVSSFINTLIFMLRQELKKHRGNLSFYFNKFLDT